ncbi:hypothetical protein Hanom_Chr04g00283821 [Helianthus anomalus]
MMIYRRICETLNGNELTPYKILKTPTITDFIRVFYTYKFSAADLSCFRTAQNANVNEKRGNQNAPITKR